jgi:GNAT superfamily N-acetyltransferase
LNGMSVLPPTADVDGPPRHVRVVPFPDIAPTFYKARLLLGKPAMPQIVTFVLQPSSPEISTCAKWRVEAFGDVLETSVEAEKKSLLAFASDQSAQIALVAKLDSVLAGICLLVRSELEPCHPVSPWLAGLYVAPKHRRRGIGRALVRAIEDQARLRRNRRIYLYTDSAIKYYERLGWNSIDQIDWKGFHTTLMTRELGS